MDDGILTVTVSQFKAKCLALFDALEERKVSRVVVTRHGRPVAELTPPQSALPSLWGCMRGTVTIPPDVDLTEPVLADPLDADHGILHR